MLLLTKRTKIVQRKKVLEIKTCYEKKNSNLLPKSLGTMSEFVAEAPPLLIMISAAIL